MMQRGTSDFLAPDTRFLDKAENQSGLTRMNHQARLLELAPRAVQLIFQHFKAGKQDVEQQQQRPPNAR